MSFKKTSDGRVFFAATGTVGNDTKAQDPDNSADVTPSSREKLWIPNATSNDDTSGTPSIQNDPKSNAVQFEILSMLKSLNERLHTTQSDRNKMRKQLQAYRGIIEGLEAKAENTERAYLELKKKLSQSEKSVDSSDAHDLVQETLKEVSQTRQLLTELEQKTEQAHRNIAHVQKTQKQQHEALKKSTHSLSALNTRIESTENKQTNIDGQLKNSASKQAVLMSKIEGIAKDRERFMRKIERIEEAVIQTRDSLNINTLRITDSAESVEGVTDGQLPQTLIASVTEKKDDIPKFLMQKNDADENLDDAGTVAEKTTATKQTRDLNFLQRYHVFPILAILGCLAIALWYLNTVKTDNIFAQADLNEFESTLGDSKSDEGIIPDAGIIFPETSTNRNTPNNAPFYLQDPQDLIDRMDVDAGGLGTQLNSIEPQSQNSVMPEAELNIEDDVSNIISDVNKAEKTKSTTAALTPKKSPPKVTPTLETPTVAKTVAPKSSTDILATIKSKAQNGNAEAQHDLAAIYVSGYDDVPQDYAQAKIWFEKAAAQGIENAQYNLGVLHHQGLGVGEDITTAIKWYTRAAENGHAEAQYNLGIAYIEGIGVPYDPQKAAQYFKTAAKSGVTEAGYNLGLIYENGLLGKPQMQEALRWYKSAAEKGNPEAITALEQLSKVMGVNANDVQNPIPQEQISSIKSGIQSQAVTAQIQEFLMARSLYPGPANGISSAIFEDALRAYQSDNSLIADGQPTTDVLSYMLAQGNLAAQS